MTNAIDTTLASLIEASNILSTARKAIATGPTPIWLKVSNATDYINNQLTAEMSA